MRGLIVLTLCAALLPCAVAAQPISRERAQALPDGPVFAYTDDRGRLVHADRLEDIPARLRAYAQRIDVPDVEPQLGAAGLRDALLEWVGQPAGTAAAADPAVYRYRSRSGRISYTNVAESVPVAQRQNARIDLSHVSLNSQLGAELDARLAARYQALQSSDVCRGVAAAAEEPLWRRTLREHPVLWSIAGLLLLLMFLTPRMLRNGWGEQWMRALSTAVPLFGLLGICVYALHRSQQSQTVVQERAKPCASATWQQAAREPDAVAQHARIVESLQTQSALLQQIQREGAQ
jgi:hypothetical protein